MMFKVVEGFGDFSDFSNCWGCDLVRTFGDHSEAVKFAEDHYSKQIKCKGDEWQSFFVLVLDLEKFDSFCDESDYVA